MAGGVTQAEKDFDELRALLLDFIAVVEQLPMSEDVYVGIDPGANGGIGLICGRHYAVLDIPTTELTVKRQKKLKAKERRATGKKTKTVEGTKSVFDYSATAEMLRLLNPIKERLRVLLEEAQAQNSSRFGKGKGKMAGLGGSVVNSALRVGIAYGMWPLYLASRGWPRQEVHPFSWKRKMQLLGKPKSHSLKVARQLFPKAPLRRAKDHNRAESLLLARYFKLTEEGKL